MFNTPLEQFIVTDYLPLTIFNLDFSFTNFLLINLLALISSRSFIYFNSSKTNYMQKFCYSDPESVQDDHSVASSGDISTDSEDSPEVPNRNLRDLLSDECIFLDDYYFIPYIEEVNGIRPMDVNYMKEINSTLADRNTREAAFWRTVQRDLLFEGGDNLEIAATFFEHIDVPTRAYIREILLSDLDSFEKIVPIANIFTLASIGANDPSEIVEDMLVLLNRIDTVTTDNRDTRTRTHVDLGEDFFPMYDPSQHAIVGIHGLISDNRIKKGVHVGSSPTNSKIKC